MWPGSRGTVAGAAAPALAPASLPSAAILATTVGLLSRDLARDAVMGLDRLALALRTWCCAWRCGVELWWRCDCGWCPCCTGRGGCSEVRHAGCIPRTTPGARIAGLADAGRLRFERTSEGATAELDAGPAGMGTAVAAALLLDADAVTGRVRTLVEPLRRRRDGAALDGRVRGMVGLLEEESSGWLRITRSATRCAALVPAWRCALTTRGCCLSRSAAKCCYLCPP